MTICYRISDFLHFVGVSSDTVAVYNSLTLGAAFLHSDLAILLQKAVGGIFDPSLLEMEKSQLESLIEGLEERRLIFPVGERRDLEDYLTTQKLLKVHGIGILYLMLTDGCNLACKYCYIERPNDRSRSPTFMGQSVADKALDKFSNVLAKDLEEPQVILYGGEPLMNKPIAEYVIQRVAAMVADGRLPKGTGVTLNTNGTLLDEAFLDVIDGTNVQISISLDGKQPVHDAMRPYVGGQGSFHRVMSACRLMRSRGIPFGFSITINGQNIGKLKETMLWLHDTFGSDSIGFNILVDRLPELMGMSEQAYAEAVTQELIECFEVARTKGIYEDRIMRKVDAFVHGYPYINDCGAPGDQIVVTPDGMVGPCQAYCTSRKYFVPLEELYDPRKHDVWNLWRYRSPLYQKQCYGCVALGICGGGCAYNAELKQGSIWGVDEAFCTHSRGTLTYLLQDLYRQAEIAK